MKEKFKKSESTFSKQFCPNNFFYVFCAWFQNGTQKNYWKSNSSVILSTSLILQLFVHFWAFLLLCGLVSNSFTMFFRVSEICLERACCQYWDNIWIKPLWGLQEGRLWCPKIKKIWKQKKIFFSSSSWPVLCYIYFSRTSFTNCLVKIMN